MKNSNINQTTQFVDEVGIFFENVQCFRILGVPETKGACSESKLWQALWGNIYNILNGFDGSITLTAG